MKQRIAYILSGIGLALAASLSFAGTASAETGADFQAGHITDDQVFYNASSMSVADIQSFLNSQVPTCDSAGNQPYYGTYGGVTYNGNVLRKNLDSNNPAPYTCLKNYYENTSTLANNIGSPTTQPAGSISAAQIIYNEAQNYSISPKVLLVLLQKESGLVTDDWPWSNEYRHATGYGCPDSAACSSTYYGFYNQVHNSARQFRAYANNPNDYNYVIGANNILYHPDPSSCGRQSVNIVDQSTASLYIFTPYVPNAAALSNLYGSGDACSSYGNRNFWTQFTDWFGTTLVPTYNWQFVSQSSDQNLAALPVGQKATLTVTAKNTGTATWTNTGANPVRLGSTHPGDRNSIFATPSWVNSVRPATLAQASVAPGATGTFTFVIQAPAATGSYNEYFDPMVEGLTWMNDLGLNFPITVVPAVLSDTVTSSTIPDTTMADSTLQATVKLHNTGNVTWYNDGKFPVKLGTFNPTDHTSVFCDTSWASCARAATLTEATVAPGSDGTFTFALKSPHVPSSYSDTFAPVAEGYNWASSGISKTINVQGPWVGVATSNPNVSVTAGEKVTTTLSFTNTGTSTWNRDDANSPVMLGTVNATGRTSAFCDTTWTACNLPAHLNEATVAPGAVGTFTVVLAAKTGMVGTYNEAFSPTAAGQSWFGVPSTVAISVAAPVYSWQILSQSYSTNSTTAVSGTTETLTLTAKNTGNFTWLKTGAHPVLLGTSHGSDRASAFYNSAWLTSARPTSFQEDSVAPGGTATFSFPVTVPLASGSYTEFFNLVSDGVSWFNDPWLNYSFKVVAPVYSWQLVSQAYSSNTTAITAGATTTVTVVAKNTGNTTWLKSGANPVHLAATHPGDRTSAFYNSSWISNSRAATFAEASVAPGANGTFSFTVTAPHTTGQYTESFNLVTEGITWLNDLWLNFVFNVTP